MPSLKVCLIVLMSVLYVADAFGQFGGYDEGEKGSFSGKGYGRGSRGAGRSGGFGDYSGSQSAGQGTYAGGQSDRKFRSTLYNDDEVYGYEANYPGGEAMYINYRSSDARASRGQQFARASPYSNGGMRGFSGQGRQQNMVRSNRATNFEQPQW